MTVSAQIICVIAAAAALLAGLIATPLMRAYARRIGFVDKPDGGRKTHKEPVALGGGIAVTVSFVIGLLAALLASWFLGARLLEGFGAGIRPALFISSALIIALGLIDDRIELRGRYKLLGQVLIGSFLIYSGLKIETIHLLGVRYELGWFATPFTLFWLLGSINAINLIDGIDGLAGSVGVILCLAVGAISLLIGRFVDIVIVLSLAGALAGFLRYNFAPATIYLGDAGSMLVGLVIGVVAIAGNAKSMLAMGLMVPIAVWSVPVLDSAAAILRRKLTGRSVFAADRGHLHHSLLTRGWSVHQASMFIALICATTCMSAVLSVVWRNELIALMTVVAVVLYLVYTKTFGHVEMSLVRDQISYSNSLPAASELSGRERSFRLRGSREWEILWVAVIEAAEKQGLAKVKLSINMPALHEVFFATWNSTKPVVNEDQLWNINHPLRIDGQVVGSLELSGVADDEKRSTLSQIIRPLDFLEPIEEDIRQIRERIQVESHDVRIGRSAAIDSPAESEQTTASP